MGSVNLGDKVKGALIGGAIGDALGYPVEFVNSYEEIVKKYGADGLTEYDKSYPWLDECFRFKDALFSDDTQMALYTMEGLLESEKKGSPLDESVQDAYLIWMGLQTGVSVQHKYDSRLSKIKELNQRRAPGATCIEALEAIHQGIPVSNSSKGCGGVMRIAPVGIFGACHGWTLTETASSAGRIAQITHQHPLSTYASALLAVIVQQCLCSESIGRDQFISIVEKSMKIVTDVYGESAPELKQLKDIIDKAITISDSSLPDWYMIETKLGGGWVAEETVAIAIFCVLRHIGDFEACVVSAVNHGGDSDSTGAVAGNIIGAILGYTDIPAKYTETLQLHNLMISMANDLTLHEGRIRKISENRYECKFWRPAVTVDAVLFGYGEVDDCGDLEPSESKADKALQILLIKRGLDPFQGKWALPGGFMKEEDESADAAVIRELNEETNINHNSLKQLGAFSKKDRDPRDRIITIAFYDLVKKEGDFKKNKGGSDAQEARWFPVNEIPELAFDHKEIFEKALKELQRSVYKEPVALYLLGKEFTITELFNLYFAILYPQYKNYLEYTKDYDDNKDKYTEDKRRPKFDRGNFVKKINGFGYILPTSEYTSDKTNSRRAKLYKFDEDKYNQVRKEKGL